MDVQLVRPRPASLVARSSAGAPPSPPEKLPEDRYRPLRLGQKAARAVGWSLPVAGGALGYVAAHSMSAWAGLGVGAPLGLALGLVVGGAADLLRSLGGGRGGVGKATVICTLLGGALTGGLSAWMVASGVSWGVPVLATIGALEGAAIGLGIHLATRAREGECEQLVQRINEDPARYNAPSAAKYLDALYSLEKKGWSINGQGLLDYQVKPDPNVTVSLTRKGEGQNNDIPVEQLPVLVDLVNGKKPPNFELLEKYPLISAARAQNMPYGGVPGRESQGWWQVERTRAYHDLKDGKALHYAHREITFTYDPAAAPPMDEFVQDAEEVAAAYEKSFRDKFDTYTLRSQGQALCNTMMRLTEEGKYPDLVSAGQAMAGWAGTHTGEENIKALVGLLAPGRDSRPLMDALSSKFSPVDMQKASDYLTSRLPLLGPSEQSGAASRFIRLTGALGAVEDAVRVDGILGALSTPVYDDYLRVTQQLADNGGARKPKDLLFDFAMLGAYATSAPDLQAHAADFSRLLKPLAALGEADQAAPVYALLKSNGKTVDEYLAALGTQKDAMKAREQLVPRGTGPASTAQLDPQMFESKLEWRSRDAVRHLEEQQSVLDQPGFERYQKTFVRLIDVSADLDTARRAAGVLQALPSRRAEVHLGIIQDLARRRGESKPEVLEDYLCAVAGRLPGQSLEDGAREYGDLLGGCAGAGFPGEAAPTFALIRAGIESGQAGKDTVRSLTDRYVKSLLLTHDGEKSRRLLFLSDSSSSVQEDQGGVTVGGVRIKRRPRS